MTIVFNGCIYNHRKLRRKLAERYAFSSTSDTEAIMKAHDAARTSCTT